MNGSLTSTAPVRSTVSKRSIIRLQRHRTLPPGQRRADAVVHTPTEREVRPGARPEPVESDGARVVENVGITVRRREEHLHPRTRRQDLVADRARLGIRSEQTLHRRVEPQELLHRGGNQLRVRSQLGNQVRLLDQTVEHQRDQARRRLVPRNQELLAEPAHLVMGQLTVDLGDGHDRQHVVGQGVTTFVRGNAIRNQFVDEREDLTVRGLGLHMIAPAEEVDDVVGPPAEVVPAITRHTEQRGDHDRREREGEQRHEVAVAVLPERPTPQFVGDVGDVVVEAGERSRSERVLQHPTMATMVRVIGGAEHARRRRLDPHSVAVAPLARTHQYIEDVGVSAQHEEWRIVGLLDVQRAAFTKVPMAGGRLDVVRVGEVRIGL